MKKQLLFLAISGTLAFTSCQNTSNVVGNWQATSIESPAQDSMLKVHIERGNKQADTMTVVDSQLAVAFGSTNVDTVKAKLREQLKALPEQVKQEAADQAKEIHFEFTKDGKAIMYNQSGNDTLAWYLARDGKMLILDPFMSDRPSMMMQLLTFDIEHASSDSLRLKVHGPKGQETYINFKPYTNSSDTTKKK